MAKCCYTKSNGTTCQAKALSGDSYCFFHSQNPEIIAKRLQANAKGGKQNKLETGSLFSEQFKLKTIGQVRDLLEFTTNTLIQGKITRSKASCIGYLANILIGAIKDKEIEDRLEVIENVLNISKKA